MLQIFLTVSSLPTQLLVSPSVIFIAIFCFLRDLNKVLSFLICISRVMPISQRCQGSPPLSFFSFVSFSSQKILIVAQLNRFGSTSFVTHSTRFSISTSV